MYGYIYKITNLITNLSYVGKHKYDKDGLDPKYLCSGTFIRKSIEKYGIENFSIDIVDIADSLIDLNNKEIYYISKYNTLSPNGYNLTTGGDGLSDPSKEVIEKMRLAKLGKKQPLSQKIKRSSSLKNVVHNKEWVNKIKSSLAGRKPSDSTLEASSKRHKGSFWCNNGVEEKMILGEMPQGFVKGRLKNPFPSSKGIKLSEERKIKNSEANKGRKWYNDGFVERMFRPHEYIPKEFSIGRLKKRSTRNTFD